MKILSPKKLLISMWIILVVCLYPCIFMYTQNIAEEGGDSILFPMEFFILVAIFIYGITLLVYKSAERATLFAAFFMIIFMNYSFVKKMFIRLDIPVNEIVFGIIALIIIIGMGVFLKKTKKKVEISLPIVGLVFSALIIMNIAMSIPQIVNSNENIKETKVNYAKDKSFKENVYFFIFDEYGGKANLKYYFDYDNTDFLNKLRDKGFSVSDNTYNRESVYTYDIVPNIFNLEYVTDTNNTPAKNKSALNNPVLFKFFKNLGYEINVINHQRYLNTKDCNVLFESNKKAIVNNEHSIGDYVLKNSFFNYIDKLANYTRDRKDYAKFVKGFFDDYIRDARKMFDCFENSWKEAKDKPTLTVGYFACPHRPCVFDENGNENNYKELYKYKKTYIGYLKYLNKEILNYVDNIKKNDPNAIIIFQADHGARIPLFSMNEYNMDDYNEKVESEMMQNAFNCVYFGNKKDKNIEGLSCINTMRYVLNELYKTDYKMIKPKENYIVSWKYDLNDND